MKKYELVLAAEDDDDVSQTDPTGLTRDAYDRLYEAITDAGFAVVDGPTPVIDAAP